MSSSKRASSTPRATEDLNRALAEIANGLLNDQHALVFQDLGAVESIAGNTSMGRKEMALALAKMNSDSRERMQQIYDARNRELMLLVAGLGANEAMIAVKLWGMHIELYEKFVDKIMVVFEEAVKSIMEKVKGALKNAYQKIKNIVKLACQGVTKLFS